MASGRPSPGPVDILFREGDFLEPDVFFGGTAQADLVSDRRIEGTPDLVVEVASPSTASRDRGDTLEWSPAPGAPTLTIDVAEGARRIADPFEEALARLLV